MGWPAAARPAIARLTPRMPLRRVLLLSLHTSPLAQPGTGDGGGMNVYVRAVAGALARAGVACDVLTRRETPGAPQVAQLERGVRLVELPVGPPVPLAREALLDLVDDLVDAAVRHVRDDGRGYHAVHANYWVAAAAGHKVKHELDLPLAVTFHTLSRVKAADGVPGDLPGRAATEEQVVGCADLVLASTPAERDQLSELYGADPARVEVVPPGVDHRRFRCATPATRAAARASLGLSGRRVALFVGRIQALKGASLALEAVAALDDPSLTLVVVGGASGEGGADELDRLRRMSRSPALAGRVRFVSAQPHHRLPLFYWAADAVLVPSHSESFGLVALEAAASGTPVIASGAVGLRSLVDHGTTGFVVAERDPAAWAATLHGVLSDPAGARALGAAAELRSRRYSWSLAAARLRRLYGDLSSRAPVRCS